MGRNFRVRIAHGASRGESASRQRYQKHKALAELLRVPLAQAASLLGEPTVLPVVLDEAAASAAVARLGQFGIEAEVVAAPNGPFEACSTHSHLVAGGQCNTCRAASCVACLREGRGTCSRCAAKAARRSVWRRRRLVVLSLTLAVVSIFGWMEWRRRTLGWDRSQRVAVVLLTSRETPSEAALDAFRNGTERVLAALAAQKARYLDDGVPPFEFRVFGPVRELRPLPVFEDDGLWSLFRFNRELAAYAASHDEAAGLTGAFDTRIYLQGTRPQSEHRQSVEGVSQAGGQIGAVSAELNEASWDFAWFVVVHELLHTRGASDKYDPHGHALEPEGLADPDRDPRYPQLGVELMARGQPEAKGQELPPGPPETWAIGKWTAREIGWVPE